MANITIDGKKLQVKDGITIIEAIDQAKLDLPRYCYHPGLSIAGNCRICQVEVENMPRTVIACNTRVAEGMVIHTESAKAKESQKVVLEFLLANHPLDCPVCDQAGECKLQDYYMDYGLYDPLFNEMKVKKTKKAVSIGPTIMLDQERCVLCTRCIRFGDEITHTHDFGIFNRGDHSEINIYPGSELNNKYSGNVADICPVGALTDKDFRFKMRVWYLGEGDSICPGCSRGCNIEVHYEKSRPYHLKDKRVMRLKPRENQNVNQWWICDNGRYDYKFIDENRILEIKTTELSMTESTNGSGDDLFWDKAIQATAKALKATSSWAVLLSSKYTNEELYLMKKIFKDHLQVKDFAFRSAQELGDEDEFLIRRDKTPNTNGLLQFFTLPDDPKAMEALLQKLGQGSHQGLFVFNHDLEAIIGADALRNLRQKVKTIIFEGSNHTSTSRISDITLPSSVYAEKEGTFTNVQGRVQRLYRVLQPLGKSRPTWKILTDLGKALGLGHTYDKASAIFDELAKDTPAFNNLSHQSIGKQGAPWALNYDASVPRHCQSKGPSSCSSHKPVTSNNPS